MTAQRLRSEIGGRIVFFYHDSDHDPRETQTYVRDQSVGGERCLNFSFKNKIQKKYSPLYAKELVEGWQSDMARQLPKFASNSVLGIFKETVATNIADFCLEMYESLGILEGIEVVRSSDPEFRSEACVVNDFFVDTDYEGEWVRARIADKGKLQLHRGGGKFIDLLARSWTPEHISPTRDSRLLWMQSVIHCTHYVAGAGELQYLKMEEAPEVEFVTRDPIDNASAAYLPETL
ncbi:MAG: hypothetical protein AAF212_02720 [Verrucomicrobiota bacterium]